MLQSIKTTEQDISNTPTNTDERNNSNYSNKEIEGTPFRCIGNAEEGYVIVMAKYKIAPQTFKTESEVEEYLAKNYFSVTLAMIAACKELDEEMKKYVAGTKEIKDGFASEI